jgi:hypothetical protein
VLYSKKINVVPFLRELTTIFSQCGYLVVFNSILVFSLHNHLKIGGDFISNPPVCNSLFAYVINSKRSPLSI